jgi:outer membrane protein TolC
MRTVAAWLLGFPLVVSTVLAQPTATPLSLGDCIRKAESAQSNLTIARRLEEIARYALVQARAGFLPQVHFGGAFTYNSPQIGDSQNFSFVALNGIREYNPLLTTALELDTSGKLRAALARARADQDAAAAQATLAARDLRRAVTAAYYRLLLARRLIGVAEDALAEAQSFEKRARLLSEKGEVAQADVVKAAGQGAFLEQVLSTARLEAESANHELAFFWTSEVAEPLTIVDVFDQPVPPPELPPGPPPSGGGPAPFLGRPEFKLLDAERRGFEADARRSRADLLPQASVVFQYGIDSLRLRIRDRGYAAFVNVGVPVFDWLRARSQVRQFELRAEQVDAQRAMAERSFSREYQTALERVRRVHRQISMGQAQVDLSAENLRLSRLRYEGGEGLALDLVAAQNQLAQARTNYYTAVANYLNARADLEVAAGK